MPADPKRVKEVFLEATELPDEAARAAFLDRSCRGDDGLRARVEALLRSHDPDGSFLGAPAAVVPDPEHAGTMTFDSANPGGRSDSDDESDALEFLAPSARPGALGRLGHYDILQVLGKGGFGIVFRAFDDNLQRVVAIKVLAPQMAATSPARRRFLREARSSAKVRHENVVQVYAVEEEPLPYLVMEFVPGETLQQRLDRTGPLDPIEVVKIGRQLAEGLAAAHGTGLIHRDIKPGNVLIESGPHRHVKITDFGLARAADDASLTQSGLVAGTPMYMAPEQANGDALDHRADLFSLGSVLYAICSGRPPFRANSTLAVLKRVVEDSPRPIPEIIPEVPQWLCDLISKLHAKDPDDRLGSAQEVADLLGRGLAAMQRQEPAPAFPELAPKAPEPTPALQQAPEPAPAPKPRSRTHLWLLLVAGVLFLFGGLGITDATGVTNARGAVRRLFFPEGAPVVGGEKPDTKNGQLAKDGPEVAPAPKPAPKAPLNPTVSKKKPEWTVLKPVEMKSEGGATLAPQADDSILVGGDSPDKDVYTLTFRNLPAKVGSLRLEVLPHDTLPNRGPGRNDAGEFVLTKVRAELEPQKKPGGPQELKLAEVWADNNRGEDSHERLTIDAEDNTGWVTEVGKPYFAVFNLAEPVATDGGVLRVSLEFKWEMPRRSLGCFRLSVAPAAKFQDPDRRVAERVLALGGVVRVDGLELDIRNADALPREAFRLTGVNLYDDKFGNKQVSDRDLATLKDCEHLAYLNLDHIGMSNQGLAELKDCPSLKYLNVGHNGVTDAGLAALAGWEKLEELNLDGLSVGDAGLTHLTGCKGLKILWAQGTRVTDAGMVHLKGCKNLTELNLNGSPVGDAGLAHLRDCKKLTKLDLWNTLNNMSLSDKGLAHLKNCTGLKELDVRGNGVTAGGIDELRKALPACKITWDGGVVEPR